MFLDAHRLRNVLPALLAMLGLGLPSAVADCTCCAADNSCCEPGGDARDHAWSGTCCSSPAIVNDACAGSLATDEAQCLCGGGCPASAARPQAISTDESTAPPAIATAATLAESTAADFDVEFSWQRQIALAWVDRPPRILYGVWRN